MLAVETGYSPAELRAAYPAIINDLRCILIIGSTLDLGRALALSIFDLPSSLRYWSVAAIKED